MKNVVTLIVIFVIILVAYSLLQKIALQPTKIVLPPNTTPQPTKAVLGTIPSSSSSQCHSDGILPDSNCTPGVTDPNVTQDNIFQTICVKGYTTTVRPDVGYTNSLKKQQIQEYGFSDLNLHDYEEDHLISLELGGSPTDPKNLWPEPGTSPNPKDKIENLCHRKVCSGQISLLDAQKQIATNWQTACL